MAIELEATRARERAEGDVERIEFPGKRCLMALLVIAGFYYFLIFAVPATAEAERSFSTAWVFALGRCAEAHPILAGAALVSLLAPAFLFPNRAGSYLVQLAVVLALIWGAAFTLTARPQDRAAQAVESILSTERPLPETIRGR
ncbi:MAG: hypothetical protein ACRDHY_15825 [Anaerolineales bacterium]